MKAILKHLIPNAGTLVVVGLLFLAQSVGALPGAEPAEPLVPSQTLISYQGTLTDPSGNPVNATVTMVFALYDAASGGNRLWGPETQSVQVSNGLFHVLLGSVTAIDPEPLSGDLYLDIKVNGETLTPRELLTSVAYAVEVSKVVASNPNNEQASVRLNWLNDVARIRVGGSGAGAGNGLDIQTIGNVSLLRISGGGNASLKGTLTTGGALTAGGDLTVAGGDLRFGNNQSALRHDGSRTLHLLPWGGSGHAWDNVCIGCGSAAGLIVRGNVSCGALTEAHLQTEEELSAERIDRFEEGDVLCWGDGQLETCAQAGDPLVQAVADANGRPIVIGAEVIKVVDPVKKGDFLVASNVPGYAMASPSPAFGTVIAQALEDFDGEQGIIKAMIRKM
jgi:hypothetical protein